MKGPRPGRSHPFEDVFLKACERTGRDPQSIRIVAVSKSQVVARLEAFLDSGLRVWGFGESYLDELKTKQEYFEGKQISLPWHFIGRLQSRKISELLKLVEVLHAVSRDKELEAIAQMPIKFFLQVNISAESSKGGSSVEELPVLIAKIEKLKLEEYFLGFMAMPSPLEDFGESRVRKEMARLRALRESLWPSALLNMGTSSDFAIAIEEGADVLRIGSSLFGEREPTS
jgi:PLP dependent protein